MANLRVLKQKRNSIKTIHKITSSMEIISITKSKQAARELARYKQYINSLDKIMQTLAANSNSVNPEFTGNLWIIFNSDLGLAGGFNNGIIKEFNQNFDQEKDEVVIIGSKGESLLSGKVAKEKVMSFALEELKNYTNVEKIIEKAINAFFEEKKKVFVIYTHYASQITFKPTKVQLLPIEPSDEVEKVQGEIEYEPNAKIIMDEVLDMYIPSKLRYFFKHSLACEHTSRRIAMENATKNGEEMLKTLSIEYNRIRQAKITQEILEILGGSESLK